MKKRILIILALIAVAAIIVFSIYGINKRKRLNSLLKKQVVHNIIFDKGSIKKKNGKYIFSITISSKENIEGYLFDAEFKDKNGNPIDILSSSISKISKNESEIIEIETESNIYSSYEITYTVYKKWKRL